MCSVSWKGLAGRIFLESEGVRRGSIKTFSVGTRAQVWGEKDWYCKIEQNGQGDKARAVLCCPLLCQMKGHKAEIQSIKEQAKGGRAEEEWQESKKKTSCLFWQQMIGRHFFSVLAQLIGKRKSKKGDHFSSCFHFSSHAGCTDSHTRKLSTLYSKSGLNIRILSKEWRQ